MGRILAFGVQELFAAENVCRQAEIKVFVTQVSNGREVVCSGVGVSGALGIGAAHLAPHWSALSNPYPEIGADALSWAVMLAEIAAACALAAVGMREAARQPAV